MALLTGTGSHRAPMAYGTTAYSTPVASSYTPVVMFPPLAWQPLTPGVFISVLTWLDFPSLAAFKSCASSIASAREFKQVEEICVKHALPGFNLYAPSALAWAAVVKRGERVSRELGELDAVLNTLGRYKGFDILRIAKNRSGPAVTLCLVALIELWKLHADSRIQHLLLSHMKTLLESFPEARVAASLNGLLSLISPNLKTEVASDLRVESAFALRKLVIANRQAVVEVAKSDEILHDVLQLLKDSNDNRKYAFLSIGILLESLVSLSSRETDWELRDCFCEKVQRFNCIPLIVRFIGNDGSDSMTMTTRDSALRVLILMVLGGKEVVAAIRSANGVGVLVQHPDPQWLVRYPYYWREKPFPLEVLRDMCIDDPETCEELCLADRPATLLTWFCDSVLMNTEEYTDEFGKEMLILDILGCVVATCPAVATKIRQMDGIEALLASVSSEDARMRNKACLTLCVVVKADRECAARLCKIGGIRKITTLVNLATSDSFALGSVLRSFFGTDCIAVHDTASLILEAIEQGAIGEFDAEAIALQT